MPGKPAARIGDLSASGGTVAFGFPTVLIQGLPAARLDDPHVCPLSDGPKVHVGGVIKTASKSVKIGGAYAARIGDLCECMVIGISGKGIPAMVGPVAPPIKDSSDGKFKDANENFSSNEPRCEDIIEDTDGDGVYDKESFQCNAKEEQSVMNGDFFQLKGTLEQGSFKYEGRGDHVDPNTPLVKDKLIPLFGTAPLDVGKHTVTSSGEKDSVEAKIFAPGDSQNPLVVGSLEASALSGEAGIETRDIGGGVGASAGLVSVKGKVIVDACLLSITPVDAYAKYKLSRWLGYNVLLELEAGASIEGGGSVLAAAYREDGRYNLELGGKVATLFGELAKIKISVGKLKPPEANGNIAVSVTKITHPIILGAMTVFIGD